MTVSEIVKKDFNGKMHRPVCDIDTCFNRDLHDIILTKDGGIYLLCKKHAEEFTQLVSEKWKNGERTL